MSDGTISILVSPKYIFLYEPFEDIKGVNQGTNNDLQKYTKNKDGATRTH